LGEDQSGNSNDWTSNNLAATDVVLDSPTNNFATLNPLDVYASDLPILAEGNLKVTVQQSGQVKSTFSVDSGQWYFEVLNSGDNNSVGIWLESTANSSTYGGNSVVRYAIGSVGAANDVFSFKLDVDSGTFEYAINGGSYTSTSFTPSGGYKVGITRWDIANKTDIFNFGQDSSFAGNKTAQGNTDANGIGDFYYAPPSGYLASMHTEST
jgi:hypothetical protein